MTRKAVKWLYEFGTDMSKKNIAAFSASTAFFIFLSLIPMLILLCAIIPYTPLTEENLLSLLTGVMADAIKPLISNMVEEVYARSAGVLSIAAIGTLWTAGKGVLALIRGLNAVNDVEENRNYFVVRIVACFYTLIMIIAVILSLFLMVFGNLFVNVLLKDFPQTKLLFEFLMHFRFIFAWAILTLFFAMVYTFVPNRRMRFTEQITGAMFSAVVWSIFSWCFSVYVDRFQGFSIYGSLATVIIIMLYLYFCMYIILIGAHINCFLNEKGGVKKQWAEFKDYA